MQDLQRDLDLDWEKKVVGKKVARLKILPNETPDLTWWVGEVKQQHHLVDTVHSHMVHFTEERKGMDYDRENIGGIAANWVPMNVKVGVNLDVIYEWKLAWEEMMVVWEPWTPRPTKKSKYELQMESLYGKKKRSRTK